MKRYLYLAPIKTFSFNLIKHVETFYVYETNAAGMILHKHGPDGNGTPFATKTQANDWIKERVTSGKFIHMKWLTDN